MKWYHRRIPLGFLVAAFTCLPVSVHADRLAAPNGDCQLVCYLETPSIVENDVTLEIERVILSGETDTVLVIPETRTISTNRLTGQQVLFVEQFLPAGDYDRLQVIYKDIHTFAGAAPIRPELDSAGTVIPVDIQLRPGRTHVAFFVWNPAADVFEQGVYRPVMTTRIPDIPPLGSLIYVTNSASGNLSIVDRFNYSVVDVLYVGRGPRGIAYSPVNQQLYVALADDDRIVAVDVLGNQLAKSSNGRLGDQPVRLAVSSDQRSLYVLNHGSNTLAVLDVPSLQERQRIPVDYAPADLAVNPASGFVYLSSTLSDGIVMIDPERGENILTIPVGASTTELAIGSRSQLLYAGNHTQPRLSIIETFSHAPQGEMRLCGTITSLALDPLTETLYAAIVDCKEIAILRPDRELEIGNISLAGTPGKISVDSQNKQLMVPLPDANQILFFDINSQKQVGAAHVGHSPYQLILP